MSSLSRHGSMPTPRPARYAKQLASHWSGKGSVHEADGTTVIQFDSGQVVELTPVEGALSIVSTVHAGGDPDAFAQVVARHLERFGTREELNVIWDVGSG